MYKARAARQLGSQLKVWKGRALLTLPGHFLTSERTRDQEHGQAKWWAGASLDWGFGKGGRCVTENVRTALGASLPLSSFWSCILISVLGPHASWRIWAPTLFPDS